MIFSVEHMPHGGETLYSMKSPMGISTSMASFASLGSENWMMNSSYKVEQIFLRPLGRLHVPRFDEPCLFQDHDVRGYRGLRKPHLVLDLVDVSFALRNISRILRRTSEARPLRAR